MFKCYCVDCNKELPAHRIQFLFCNDVCQDNAMIFCERRERVGRLDQMFASGMEVGEIAEVIDSETIAREFGISRPVLA